MRSLAHDVVRGVLLATPGAAVAWLSDNTAAGIATLVITWALVTTWRVGRHDRRLRQQRAAEHRANLRASARQKLDDLTIGGKP